MKNRKAIVRQHREYKALILRLQHGKVKITGYTCEEVLAIIERSVNHKVYAYFDETIRLFTFHQESCRTVDLEIIMYLESYQQPVEHGTSRITSATWRR